MEHQQGVRIMLDMVDAGMQARVPPLSITPTMKIHLQKLARAMLLRKYPILLQVCNLSGHHLYFPSWALHQTEHQMVE